jgi:hypothetical protein
LVSQSLRGDFFYISDLSVQKIVEEVVVNGMSSKKHANRIDFLTVCNLDRRIEVTVALPSQQLKNRSRLQQVNCSHYAPATQRVLPSRVATILNIHFEFYFGHIYIRVIA